MFYEVKKMFKGFVSVRDYIIKKCADRNEELVIIHKGKRMTVPVKVLKNLDYFQIHRTKFASKYKDGQTYELCDFVFQPDKVQQGKLL